MLGEIKNRAKEHSARHTRGLSPRKISTRARHCGRVRTRNVLLHCANIIPRWRLLVKSFLKGFFQLFSPRSKSAFVTNFEARIRRKFGFVDIMTKNSCKNWRFWIFTNRKASAIITKHGQKTERVHGGSPSCAECQAYDTNARKRSFSTVHFSFYL